MYRYNTRCRIYCGLSRSVQGKVREGGSSALASVATVVLLKKEEMALGKHSCWVLEGLKRKPWARISQTSLQGHCRRQEVYKESLFFCNYGIDGLEHWAPGSVANIMDTESVFSGLPRRDQLHKYSCQTTVLDAPAPTLSRTAPPPLLWVIA